MTNAEKLRTKVARDAARDGYKETEFLNFLNVIKAFDTWEEIDFAIRPVNLVELEELFEERGNNEL